jgi:type I restriction enzyme S subunit
VLAKAFRGELVPQDPDDEPASALLTRVASSNTPVVGKNKRKVPVALMERAQAAINL